MDGYNTSSTDELSDDDLPDVPLIQRIARQKVPVVSERPDPKIDVEGNRPFSSMTKLKPTAISVSSSNKSPPPPTGTKRIPPSLSIEISDDDDDDPLIPTKVQKTTMDARPVAPSRTRDAYLGSSTSSTSLSSGTEAADANFPGKLNKREEKRRKEEEKLRKKLEKEREAATKKADAQRKKALRPGEAPKCIVVDLDAKLLEAPFGGLLLQEIQTLGAGTQIEPHPDGLSDTIFFWRRDPASFDDVGDDENKTLELFCVVYLTAKEFVSLVANGKNEKAGISTSGASSRKFVEEKAAKLKDVKLTLVIDGIEKHFRNVKTLQQREYRQRVNGQKSGMTAALWTDVNRLDVEESKIELQLFHGVHVIQVETKEEMAAAVVRFTKSVAERPHKQMMQGHAGGLFSFCSDSSATSIKPNAIGEGLLKAWKKQLTQFTLVSDDVANAVVAAYSSPQLLRNGFQSSPSPALLLQDLHIRRGAGPLETSRKVGPELSKRIFQFFTAIDGDQKITM